MSTSRNTDAVANQMPGGGSGEFRSKVAPDEPLTSKGHQPGQQVGNDAVPEFSAETLPAGTAPANRTFQPNISSEVDPNSDQAAASETITGATSVDVSTGLGHPGSGQTSAEMRHDGQSHRKNPGQSLEGVGATTEGFKTADPRDPDFKHLRALDKDEAEVGRGTAGGLAAQERIPENAETVSRER